MKNKQRWFLQGTLTTSSPLHMGCGEPTTRAGLLRDDDTGELAEVQAVAMDHRARPYLPGSALKGALRRLCASTSSHGDSASAPDDPPTRLEGLFGSTDRGARLTVHDAFLDDLPPPTAPPSFWDADRHTGVAARVALQRVFGTASPQRLFHLEFVPPGAVFQLEIDGTGLDADDLAWLLAALERFGGGADSPALGARSGDGWGRLSWQETSLRTLGRQAVVDWLQTSQGLAREAATPPSTEVLATLRQQVESFGKHLQSTDRSLAVALELAFDEIFLVRDTDPDKCGQGSDRPDATWRRDAEGHIVLPASSLRGSLRSHAERILRTLGGVGAACGNEAPRSPCAAVQIEAERPEGNRQQLLDLCPACRVFGAPGWKSPLQVEDFVACRGDSDQGDNDPCGSEEIRHFVAIDRFTGGAARERKFQIEARRRPRLGGVLRLDLDALAHAGVGAWALAWMGLLLRDVIEGDVTFGAGASKGQGSCRGLLKNAAQIEPEMLPQAWASDQNLDFGKEFSPFDLATTDPLHQSHLTCWVEELETVATQEHEKWSENVQETGS